MDLQDMGLSPELFEQIDGRTMTLQDLMGIIVQSMTTAILQMLLNQISG